MVVVAPVNMLEENAKQLEQQLYNLSCQLQHQSHQKILLSMDHEEGVLERDSEEEVPLLPKRKRNGSVTQPATSIFDSSAPT
jgi:hypothetical protein